MTHSNPHLSASTDDDLVLRPPDVVMQLSRMGAAHPTRLSFMRRMLRKLGEARASVERGVWDIDDQGYGAAVYSVHIPGDHSYSLVAFSTMLDPEARTDRVIAEAWDTTYVLYDGVPDEAEIERLSQQAPKQEAGRYCEKDLILSRANKSIRLFEHVVGRLCEGLQPDEDLIRTIGYLMRTTAVYGNGKFGIADRDDIVGRYGLDGPFHAELMLVWLIRSFTHDLVDHVAYCRAPEKAVRLATPLKRFLGIGNATGLGMAPFLVSHPILLHHWVRTRETALARICDLDSYDEGDIDRFQVLLSRAVAYAEEWSVEDERQQTRIMQLRVDLEQFAKQDFTAVFDAENPWKVLLSLSDTMGDEAQELLIALVLEMHGSLVDDLADGMASQAFAKLDPTMRVDQLKENIEACFGFALEIDFDEPQETHQFWYVSEDKLEPRLGQRHSESGAEREMPLDIARQVQVLHQSLAMTEAGMSVAEFLMQQPHHRYAVRRMQTHFAYPYSEIHENLISDRCLPIDMLRFKLSFFGAGKFDPKSDLWTRVNLFQGAPLINEIDHEDADDWWLMSLDHLKGRAS